MLSVSKWATAGCDALVAVLLAPACAACGVPLETPTQGAVCAACWRGIAPIAPPVCETCGDALPSWRLPPPEERRCTRCRRVRTVITRTTALGPYEGSLRAIVHALKYDGRRSVARRLGTLMRVRGAHLLLGADAVVPVPLHRMRRLSRGFNQASDLARHLGVPVAHALRRTRYTGSQADLPASRRHANVRGAFRLARGARATIGGRCLVLVDDVSTTGATLEACARTLLDGGAREVRAIIAARAVSRSV